GPGRLRPHGPRGRRAGTVAVPGVRQRPLHLRPPRGPGRLRVRRLPLVHRGADRLLRAAAASAARRRAAGGRPLPPAGRRPHRRLRLVRPTHLRPTRRPPAAHGPTRADLEGTVTLSFTPATRSALKARVALDGPSGSGKTYTALLTARA